MLPIEPPNDPTDLSPPSPVTVFFVTRKQTVGNDSKPLPVVVPTGSWEMVILDPIDAVLCKSQKKKKHFKRQLVFSQQKQDTSKRSKVFVCIRRLDIGNARSGFDSHDVWCCRGQMRIEPLRLNDTRFWLSFCSCLCFNRLVAQNGKAQK